MATEYFTIRARRSDSGESCKLVTEYAWLMV